MTMSYDYEHTCPRCGGPWKVRILSLVGGDGAYWTRAGSSGECGNPQCPMSASELAAVRATRRRLGWDRWLTGTG